MPISTKSPLNVTTPKKQLESRILFENIEITMVKFRCKTTIKET